MSLGDFLEETRTKHRIRWKVLLFGVLIFFLILNVFILPHHAEYVYDKIPGFWAAFGGGVAIIMVFIMKKIIQPRIVRPEDSEDE